MKSLFRKIVLKVLEVLARIKLKRMGAKTIGITGAVGKTSCKEVVFSVLAKKYKVLRNEKSFNSEFGLPLTILHQKSGFSSPVQWLKILVKGFFRTFFVKDKYDFIILEMGVDKAGDMDFLTKIAPPDIALITAIKPVHMASGQFATVNEIFNEKKKIFDSLKNDGIALIAIDDKFVGSLANSVECKKCITYGVSGNAKVHARNVTQAEKGLTFSVHYQNKEYQFRTNLFGEYQLSILMPAIILGLINDVPIQEIQDAIASFRLPPGRLSLIKGTKDTLILDSSYNASPEAVIESLKVLDFFGKKRNKRRIFLFGNMNELGQNSRELHENVGKQIPASTDILITVGEDVKFAADQAIKGGLAAENIRTLNSAKEAADYYKKIMQEGDIILAKGSQNKVRLEIFVKELMANPEEAKEKLVRQGKNWENIAP
ncbi:UDP-N-acetylmuramoyl-tripeptide--D-alanyl-D-alanine ligase [Patescibacteria group bacterium]